MCVCKRKNQLIFNCPISFIGVMVVLFLVGANVSNIAAKSTDVLRNAVVEGIEGNLTMLNTAHLVWQTEFGAYNPYTREKLDDLKGEHELWWDGDKIATSYTEEQWVQNGNDELVKKVYGRETVYNANQFRVRTEKNDGSYSMALAKEPRFLPEEDYLKISGWRISGMLKPLYDETKPDHIKDNWLIENGDDGSKLIKWEIHNNKTGQIGIRWFDPEKGFVLVSYENYASLDHLQSRTTFQYQQVSGGAWFPIEVNRESFNIQTGEILQYNNAKVDVNKSFFNDASRIPADTFEMKIGPDTEVSDYMLGEERLLYSTAVSPVEMEELKNLKDDFLVNNETTVKETSDHTYKQGEPSNTDIDVTPSVKSNEIKVSSPASVIGNKKSTLAWLIIAVGAVVCVLSAVILIRHFRSS